MFDNIDLRDAFFKGVYDIIANDKNVIILTADHGAFGLNQIQKDFPSNYINVGIAEQNMVSVAAGMALSGKKVYIYSIVNFVTLRCFEQISVDLSAMDLCVNIIGVGAGLTYSTDGPTHHGTQDVAAMSSIPNIAIYNCSDAVNTYAFAKIGYEAPGPKYFRIEKGVAPCLYKNGENDFNDGLAVLKKGVDSMIVSSGLMTHKAMKAARILGEEGIDVGVIDVYRLKPLNKEFLISSLKGSKKILTFEDNILTGGLGEKVGSAMAESGCYLPISKIAIDDQHCFIYSKSREWVEDYYGLNVKRLVEKIKEWI